MRRRREVPRALSLRRGELEKRCTRKVGTHATFTSIFRFLVAEGYIRKIDGGYCDPFLLTERGVWLLSALEVPSQKVTT